MFIVTEYAALSHKIFQFLLEYCVNFHFFNQTMFDFKEYGTIYFDLLKIR